MDSLQAEARLAAEKASAVHKDDLDRVSTRPSR